MGFFICAVILISSLSLLAILFKLYVKLTTGWCHSNVCLVGKTAIITGANCGIGYQTAEDFAKRGARVILACRNPKRGQDALASIINATDNKNVFLKTLDLSSFASVRKFADEIKASESRLDILVNNAGQGGKANIKTEDGLLRVMQVNHFGPFLLTNLLLDLLKRTPNSRIVNVSSMAAREVKHFDVTKLNVCPEGTAVEFRLYSRSKLCNILFTIELANRLKGTNTTTYSIHPGVVDTEIFRTIPKPYKYLLDVCVKSFFKNSTEGAQTSIHCSVAKGIEIFNGEHFSDCHYVSRYKTAADPDLPRKLWDISTKLVKLN